jgi:uncharacterized UPF0160 family protein
MDIQIQKIVTHDGQFHADEVFATAMLYRIFKRIDLTRTRDEQYLKKSLSNPDVIVIDVGAEYNRKNNNFDHHQDMSLKSAAGLIFDAFGNRLGLDDLELSYFAKFIDAIDAIDTNRNNIYVLWNTLPEGFRNFSSLISGFNRDVSANEVQREQFFFALDFASIVLQNEIFSARQKAVSEREYADRVILPNNVAVFEKFSTVWKDKSDHQFAVMPHHTGWQILTRDSFVAVIPESVAECEGFIFRHGSGFMATVKERLVAIEFAQTLPVIEIVKADE